MMFISYERKGDAEYAKLNTAVRKGGKKINEAVNLGRVLDKQKGIFKNRERGIFQFTIEDGYSEPAIEDVPDTPVRGKEQLIVDFGDTFLLNHVLKTSGMYDIIGALGYRNTDTLLTMVSYYVLCSHANSHVQDWWEGNYARILYPKAMLDSRRISEFLSAIGNEQVIRIFFQCYLKHLFGVSGESEGILIDSTGLPNSIHFPLTAISNHNGELHNEVRLIYVTQQDSGMPIYFRYCPGNVIDTSTLTTTIAELKQYGVNTKFAILDAGYYTDENIRLLYDHKISFVTRLKGNRRIYRDLVKAHVPTMETKENLVRYNSRYAYITCVECELIEGHRAYAYIGVDIERKNSESRKTFRKAYDQKLSNHDVYDAMQSQGVFILVSSRRIAKDKILPVYYTRSQIEQVFDIGKNYAQMLPVRVHKEETFRGHLLLTFMATVICKLIQDKTQHTHITLESMIVNLRNHKCKVYPDTVIVQEAFKKANDCYKLFKINCPVQIHR